ncbi:MAG: serine O-acetyltransferase [Bacteroidota bacterium]|nr:serine acetyltransferase [Flavisolibacter sp.]MBD0364870.1 serine acetyltransferase [Flavisolibacter sp.]MBD0374226.1 serine acetyltransferase [Flavisolibacter sp.]MDQ3846658.1 serine O-acetyltransferase [Bacteroidota bacterium]
MNTKFYQQLYNKQQQKEAVPSNEVIAAWASKLILMLYPELSTHTYPSTQDIEAEFKKLEQTLIHILDATKACSQCNHKQIARFFFNHIPELFRLLNTDVHALLQGDPAAHSEFEVIRAYPGFYALCFYRIAHSLLQLEVPLLPRILTEYAHSRTGIDIHPAARIGEYFMIDHGTGVVIGETAHIGDYVKIYQGVTLGALSVDKEMAFTKRHPTVEDHVVIYSGATILGGDTVIGHHSVIGGNVWLTRSVPPGSLVYHNPEITVVEGKIVTS